MAEQEQEQEQPIQITGGKNALLDLKAKIEARITMLDQLNAQMPSVTDAAGIPSRDQFEGAVCQSDVLEEDTDKRRVVIDIRKLPKDKAAWMITRVRVAQRRRLHQALIAIQKKLDAIELEEQAKNKDEADKSSE